MQHSISQRTLKIIPRVFEFIYYKQKYKYVLFIIYISIKRQIEKVREKLLLSSKAPNQNSRENDALCCGKIHPLSLKSVRFRKTVPRVSSPSIQTKAIKFDRKSRKWFLSPKQKQQNILHDGEKAILLLRKGFCFLSYLKRSKKNSFKKLIKKKEKAGVALTELSLTLDCSRRKFYFQHYIHS